MVAYLSSNVFLLRKSLLKIAITPIKEKFWLPGFYIALIPEATKKDGTKPF